MSEDLHHEQTCFPYWLKFGLTESFSADQEQQDRSEGLKVAA